MSFALPPRGPALSCPVHAAASAAGITSKRSQHKGFLFCLQQQWAGGENRLIKVEFVLVGSWPEHLWRASGWARLAVRMWPGAWLPFLALPLSSYPLSLPSAPWPYCPLHGSLKARCSEGNGFCYLTWMSVSLYLLWKFTHGWRRGTGVTLMLFVYFVGGLKAKQRKLLTYITGLVPTSLPSTNSNPILFILFYFIEV